MDNIYMHVKCYPSNSLNKKMTLSLTDNLVVRVNFCYFYIIAVNENYY